MYIDGHNDNGEFDSGTICISKFGFSTSVGSVYRPVPGIKQCCAVIRICYKHPPVIKLKKLIWYITTVFFLINF